MPQLIFFILIGLIAWYGYRSFKREAARVSQRVRQAEKEASNRAHGTLVQDPKTGEYHVRED
ncbi:hypothetical protein ATN84_01020 [Paramesorhizobium deserti]|uniref:Uncharacterized protein n=1 Tax=Paramesorhizobium deserti TaxID=1494590 RepID=A0A135HZ22_9HYPH|nr:LapA family protein [Paramesorhizobium deserti]KXF78413.1 hypothetical protein ATN84_01020 [Paramesorhizobium deserti]